MIKGKILLVGKSGQVGFELSRQLPLLGEVVALDRQHLNLLDAQEIRQAVRHFQPELIVNSAAYTAVDQAEKEPDVARAINSVAPAILAEEARKIGASFVHYSTDYVFDGTKNSPYEEDDAPNPLNVYGKTKLEGEQAVKAAGGSYLIFRTSWVYATRGRNFLLTILRLATQREELRIVRDQFGSPTTSGEIANATHRILERIHSERGKLDLSGIAGLYHLTAAGVTTWHEFASAIVEEAAKAPSVPWLSPDPEKLSLKVRNVIPITTAEYPTPAKRPPYSVLSNDRLSRAFHLSLPDWRIQLNRLFLVPPQ